MTPHFLASISVFRRFSCTVIHAETPEIADENGLPKTVSKVKHFETVFITPRENNGTLFYLKDASFPFSPDERNGGFNKTVT